MPAAESIPQSVMRRTLASSGLTHAMSPVAKADAGAAAIVYRHMADNLAEFALLAAEAVRDKVGAEFRERHGQRAG